MRGAIFALLACLAAGACAVIFQGPVNKSCLPWTSRICRSLTDRDR